MKSHSDVSLENEKAISEANKRVSEKTEETGETEDDRATRFDGDPQPVDGGGVLKPKDDTPMRLEKREGPRD